MIKKISVNIILILLFVVLVTIIVLSFVAEVQFEQAKKLESNYLWRKAEKAYLQAVDLNPFNAKYFAGAGDFLMRQSRYRKDKVSWLNRAEGLYGRAAQLNPRYAEYRYLLGKLHLAQSSGDREKKRDIDRMVDNFKAAIERDPYNFRMNYLIGHTLLTVWDSLGMEEKGFALDRLKYILRLKPWYVGFVYPSIMYYTKDFSIAPKVTPQTLVSYEHLYSFIQKNNLWEFRRKVAGLVDFYTQKEKPEEFRRKIAKKSERIEKVKKTLSRDVSDTNLITPEDWQGVAENGQGIFKDGNMYWTGTVDALIDVPEGNSTLVITAKGSPANGVLPYMIVELDGKEVGETFVESSEWKKYSFAIDTSGGLRVVSVTFANNGSNGDKTEDRNLYLGEAKIVAGH